MKRAKHPIARIAVSAFETVYRVHFAGGYLDLTSDTIICAFLGCSSGESLRPGVAPQLFGFPLMSFFPYVHRRHFGLLCNCIAWLVLLHISCSRNGQCANIRFHVSTPH
ncbi:hypothetical protein PISMIDRAFT_281085 [Pisolithus microcarpus 441]|nr:hypothetical protein PISMIDRAFT_281085 [Pisolithus microcarpus 441]